VNIPKTILQLWGRKETLTPPMISAMDSWRTLNPSYGHILMFDDDCRSFLKEHFTKDVCTAFELIKPGAGKADLFRYCYLYVKGGVYVDIDNICIKPLDNIIKKESEFIGVLDLAYKGVYSEYNEKRFSIHQSFIACIPGHPWLDMAIKLSTYNILNKVIPSTETTKYLPQQSHPLIKICGPKLLADAINISSNKPINSTFSTNKTFPFRLVKGDGSVINDEHGNPVPGQWLSTIQDEHGNVVIRCKYDEYNAQNYWTKEKIYNG
tara:strand:- start:102 stop:896 length:795 start_codon:yes stop_codon:yes gene_type:complete